MVYIRPDVKARLEERRQAVPTDEPAPPDGFKVETKTDALPPPTGAKVEEETPKLDAADIQDAAARAVQKMLRQELAPPALVQAAEDSLAAFTGPPDFDEDEEDAELEAAIKDVAPATKAWFRKHPEYVKDPEKNAEVKSAHYKAIKAGHEQLSQGYFDYVEKRLGLHKSSNRAPLQYDERPTIGGGMLPVSRSSYNLSSGHAIEPPMRLSEAQLEICRLSGVDTAEYAQNYKRMQEMKKAGVIQT